MNRLLIATMLILANSQAFSAESCPLGDPGFLWSRALVDFQRDQGSGYCRVVGDKPNWFIRCSVNRKVGGCRTVESGIIADMGYDHSQYWADKNDDGYIDFCRTVGNQPFTFTRCTLGPDFDKELDIK